MYSQSKRLEDRLVSAYLALAVSLAVAVVSLVVAVMAWLRSSRQSAGGYDVCG
jgi:sensor domain CHASE-containing protein